ncbi:tetrapyrrole biosynthesis, uroporphyrinogen III synthase [Calocera viscosa TUFC12733]|uniref:Tetrapyrrole biosynthesis, uroporphyrinogen III synthase n=1 Tax=Calocera viscosa (strain TUFC12733) TaxID=1330018 RepID=A0A167NFC3_CALVF|nr:tetrapyrrole biosynthesis, uroporphyrinogen III synthase [Calocera viscosa TUFC12733]
MRPKAVLVFKSPSTEDASLDPYYKALSDRGYSPHFVPVFEDAFCNEDELDSIVLAGPSTFSGVIITSGRAVKAWEHSVRRVMNAHVSDSSAGWDRISFYAVGPKTAQQMRSMAAEHHLDLHLCPKTVLGDEASGTGERLAHYIVDDLRKRENRQTPEPSLLYLTGDKVLPTTPNILRQAGISITSLKVYEARTSSTFESDLTHTANSLKDEALSWIAFFSPYGVSVALPSLHRRFNLQTTDGATGPHLAAIGPTTASSLRNEWQLAVAAMAQKPNPQALADAISSFDTSNVQ